MYKTKIKYTLLKNVLYASNSIVSIVHKLLVFQIVFQITFIRRKILIKPPLFQATIVIFFYTKMKDFMQGASKSTGKSLEVKAFFACL